MDSLFKQGLDFYNKSQQNPSKTGGHEYNTTPSQDHSSPHVEFNGDNEHVRHAEKEGFADKSVFSSAIGYINKSQSEHTQPLDENHIKNAHGDAYDERGNIRPDVNQKGLDASSLGSAAALQIMKKFTSSSSSGSEGKFDISSLITMAMAEATKLFSASGGTKQGTQQDAVNSAGMTIMKLMVQSKLGGTTGGSNSGGLGSLMGMASKFM